MKQVYNLVIEVTKKCNMECEHCLRGCAQNVDMSLDMAEKLAREIDPETVTFTGGEPMLNTKAIIHYYETLKLLGRRLPTFFIATNAKYVDDKFLNYLDDLHSSISINDINNSSSRLQSKELTYDDIHTMHEMIHAINYEGNTLTLSFDEYHESVPTSNIIKLMNRPYFTLDKVTDGSLSLISTGLAAENYLSDTTSKSIPCIDEYLLDDDYFEGYSIDMLYVSSEGYVTVGCDMSFDTVSKRANLGNLTEETLDFILARNQTAVERIFMSNCFEDDFESAVTKEQLIALVDALQFDYDLSNTKEELLDIAKTEYSNDIDVISFQKYFSSLF